VAALDEDGTLESPETGIVDSHGLMAALMGQFEEDGEGVLALRTAVVGVEPVRRGAGGWNVRVRSAGEDTETSISAEVVVNAAGLGAVAVHNMLCSSSENPPLHPHMDMFFAKGTYFSYHPTTAEGARVLAIRRLVYPVHPPGHAGLGTHLTLDLAGRVRFGPDVQWVDSADDLDVRPRRDNASGHSSSSSLSSSSIDPRVGPAAEEIRSYLVPRIDVAALAPDYAGMRPKLAPAGSGFQDFVIQRSAVYEGWVDLLGIESPGLTSALAIAERVDALLYGGCQSSSS
jgi:L-2-hydroxyglutarate oxidase LhgO